MNPSTVFAIAITLVRRPGLWYETLRALRSMAKTGWWRRRPYLPIPDRDWMRFRLITAYGGDGSPAPSSPARQRAHDVVTWLEWRKQFPRG